MRKCEGSYSAQVGSSHAVHCRLPEVKAQFEDMQKAGFKPTVYSFNSLLEACKRCARPDLAHAYLHEAMPTAGVQPDSISWNSLLGAYGRNGHIDGAYATWQVRLHFQLRLSCLFHLGLVPCVLRLPVLGPCLVLEPPAT